MLGNELELNRLLNTLGWLHIECHDLDRGLAFSAQGLELARRSRHATGFERVAFNLADQADAFLSKGDLALASEVLDEAIHIVEHPPASRWMTWRYATHCLASLGELWLARGDLAQAERFADQSLEIAVPTRSRKYEVRALRVKAESALARRRSDEAEGTLRRALAIAQDIASPRQTWLTHAALGRLHAERKDADAARLAYHAARQTIERVKEAVHDPELRAGLGRAPAIREIYERSGPEA
jgi:tetratricopeptide (TPR) repeat protein